MKRSLRSDLRVAVLTLLALAYVTVMVSQFTTLTPPLTNASHAPVAALRVHNTTTDEGVAVVLVAMARKPTAVEAESQAPVEALVVTPAPMAVATPTAAPTEKPAASSILRGRRTMVLVVNFVDSKRCGQTLQSLFENAVQPELLRVSIHDQIHEERGDLPCVDEYCQRVGERTCRRAQIVSTKVDADDARGPTIARSITEKEIRDEEFCLGLDSHVVFAPKWDEKVVANWEATENPKAILTVYPKSTEFMENRAKDNKMGYMCNARIEQPDPDTMIQYQAVNWIDRDNTTKPRLQSQFAGGFNFGSCQAYKDVPNDPFTPILFYGEEYVRAARLWTWGYDFYAPSVDVVYHWFETRTKIWDDNWSTRHGMMARSKRRVRFMLGLPVSVDDFDHSDLDKYGLGTKRTFEQWKTFSKIDPLAKWTDKTRLQFQNCGDLQLVPYNE